MGHKGGRALKHFLPGGLCNPVRGKDMERKSTSMWAEESGAVIGYMCMIDWECELGGASDGNHIYPSIESLKNYHPMWQQCGIVEVEVKCRKIIVEQNLETDDETVIRNHLTG